MNSKNLYIDVNVIQTVPASNLNRDDTGSPKTCIYGGATRARVSSQAWKYAMRHEFKNLLPEDDLGIRTKKIISMVADQIAKINPEIDDKQVEKMARKALENAGLKYKKGETETSVLFLMSRGQAKALAQLITDDVKDNKRYKDALLDVPNVDMACFGRMVADPQNLSYDAACQVAHAISTHDVETEYDYFTALDDLKSDDTSGAGYLSITEFNSSTLYRYANINCSELSKNCKEQTPEIVCAFVKAFITSMPTGKQNSFANRTLPAGVYIAVRTDRPVSMAPAFEEPIEQSTEGFEKPSMNRLVEYSHEITDYVDEPAASFVIGKGLKDLGEPLKLSEVLDQLKETISNQLPDGGH